MSIISPDRHSWNAWRPLHCLLVDVYTGLTLIHLCFQKARLQIICPRQHLLLCTWQTVLQQMRKRINPKGRLCRQLVMTYSSTLKYSCTKKPNYLFWIPTADVQTMQDVSNKTQLQNSCLSSDDFCQVSVRYLHLPVGALVIYTGCDCSGKLRIGRIDWGATY